MNASTRFPHLPPRPRLLPGIAPVVRLHDLLNLFRLLGLLACIPLPSSAAPPPSPAQRPDIRRDATVAAVEKVLPCVVNIGTLTVERADPYEDMLRQFFGYRRRAPDTVYSSGSGVIIDDEGWVLTNFHVVRDAARVQVTVAGHDQPIQAEVVSKSEADDLALLRLKAPSGTRFQNVDFAADDDLFLGETVIALGNPYGLGGSVSRGILSSKTRRAERDGEAMEPEDWLQTDASINPGNSGGPLINLRGELIGLNVAILAQAQGIGFAIPVKRVTTAVSRMFSPENTHGLWFGASVRGSHPPVLVADVQEESPAASAGLLPGDEILSINGQSVRSFLHLYRQLNSDDAPMRLTVQRAGRRRDLAVRLLRENQVYNVEYLERRLGLTLEPPSRDLLRQLQLRPGGALVITSVAPDSPAAHAGLARGQIVTAIDGQPPGDIIALGRSLQRRKPGDQVNVDLISARRRGMILQLSESQVRLRLR